MSKTSHNLVLATLCYLKRDGKTLMLHRIKKADDIHAGKWNGVGGKFLPGETPEQCAIREIEEETGYLATNPQLKGFLTFPKFKDDEDWYVFVYVVTEFSGELRQCEEGELQWINDDKVLQLNLWEGDSIFLQWLAENRFFSARFIYQQQRCVGHEVTFH